MRQIGMHSLWATVGRTTQHPPATCTTVSHVTKGFYQKYLLDFERVSAPSTQMHFESCACCAAQDVHPQMCEDPRCHRNGSQLAALEPQH